jgi:serine/threonine protein kinase
MIGKVINDRYEILAEIGEGGMAAVYKALDLRLQREVAIKILHPQIAKHEEFCQRFYQEAAIAAKLVHPNIVQIHDYGTSDDGRTFIVSELIRGRDFHHLQVEHTRARGEPVPALFSAMVCEEILRALAAAHKHNVVHRDVKPDNVMIASDGTVKLTDFGIAKNMGASITVVGHFLGSPVYSSPEQVQGVDIDFRSDIFSTGIILYEAITGSLPFNGQNAHEVMMRIARGNYTHARNLRPPTPKELDDIINTALQQDPSNRFQSAEAMAEALKQFLLYRGIENCRAGLELYFSAPDEFIKRSEGSNKRERTDQILIETKPDLPTEPVQQENPLRTERKATRTAAIRNNDERFASQKGRKHQQKSAAQQRARTTQTDHTAHPRNSSQILYPIFAFVAFVAAAALFYLVVPWNTIVSLNRIPPTPTAETFELPTPAATRIPADTIPARISPRSAPESVKPNQPPASTPETRRVATTTSKPPRKSSTPEPVRVAMVTTPRQTLPLGTVPPQPTPARLTMGRILIQTIPSGVNIAIDGKNMGTVGSGGEGKLLELKPGPHMLSILPAEISGVRYSGLDQRIYVESGKTTSVGTLRLLPYRQLTLAIAGPGVVARINGDPYALNGRPITLSLPEGHVEIRARAMNGKVFERTINLKGDNLTLNVSLE